MNPLIKPIYYLMNQLSYRNKFMLISSVFAIPLAVFAWQLAYTHHQQAEQAKQVQSGLAYLQDASRLLRRLEEIRDTAVVISWKSDSFLKSVKQRELKESYHAVIRLLEQAPNEDSRPFLLDLKQEIENQFVIAGNESELLDGVFDDVNIVIQRAYKWRSYIAHSFVTSSPGQSQILSLLNILNESQQYAYSLGLIRTFGALYLGQSFVESKGVDSIEKAYLSVAKQIRELDLKNKEYEGIVELLPEAGFDRLEAPLTQARDLLNTHLIETMTPDGDAEQFYTQISLLYDKLYQRDDQLLGLIDQISAQQYEETVGRLQMFYVSVLLISLLILYLSAGLYQSVRHSIRDLSTSAARVAEGKYDRSIGIDANDELSSVAEAMDQMRLSIKEREAKLELMSQTDGLTGLYNRPFFDKAMDASLANSRRNLTPMAVVMMDIDHFKNVNDTYGHQAGDEYLRQVARLVKAQFQRQTDIVARYGGEEFIAILYGQDIQAAVDQTERLRRSIELSVLEHEGRQIKYTSSFGIAALSPPCEVSSKALIALADELLYTAKESGRNQVCSQVFGASEDSDTGSDTQAEAS